MKIKMLQDITIGYGPQRLFQGDIVDLPPAVATSLIASQDALPLEPIPAEKPKATKSKVNKPKAEKPVGVKPKSKGKKESG